MSEGPEQAESLVRVGSLTIDVVSRRLQHDNRTIDLREMCRNVFFFLYGRRNQKVDNSFLLEQVWGRAAGTIDTGGIVRGTIAELRKGLKRHGYHKYIVTEAHGYSLNWSALCRDRGVADETPQTQQSLTAASHGLPAPPGDFVGRVKELGEIIEAERGGTRIIGLHGLAGVGKTALALKLSEHLSPLYPDGQCYVDLRGTSGSPVNPSGAMHRVIWSLRPDAVLPVVEAELGMLYRTVLHNKRALLLFDNARNAAHIRSLLPPLTCILLVTSRQRFAVPGTLSADLAVLSDVEARDLLLAISPGLGETATKIASLCGCLPLALRAAGTILAERADLDPQAYLRALKSARARLALTEPAESINVEASFQLSYGMLNSELQQRFRALAVFPGTFDANAAAGVWSVDPVSAQEFLNVLRSYSLLQHNKIVGRYSLHDLVRLFADARLSTEERPLARRNHALYFERVLRKAEMLYLRGGMWAKAGLAVARTEMANIVAGLKWAGAYRGLDTGAAELCCRYPESGAHVLEMSLPARERITLLGAALKAARRLRDRKAECRHLGSLGVAYWRVSQPQRSKALFKQSLALARELRDLGSEAQAWRGLGLAIHDLRQFRRAVDCHKQALKIDRRIGEQRAQGRDLNNLGLAYAATGDSRRAIKCHENHLALARQIGDRRAESAALGNLGIVYRTLGKARHAIRLHRTALKICVELGDRVGEAGDLWGLGLAYADLGRKHLAIRYQRKALSVAREIGDPSREIVALFGMSVVLAQLGKFSEAILGAEEAFRKCKSLEHRLRAQIRTQIAKWRSARSACGAR